MRSLFYIDRNRIFYYGGNTSSPIELPFPPSVVADIEVLDEIELTKILSEFIKKNKIQHSSTLIFFSPSSFFKRDLPDSLKPEEYLLQKQKFIENVPFNHVLETTFEIKPEIKTVVVVNRDFTYSIRNVLQKLGFTIEAIVPSFALFSDQQINFNTTTAQTIMKHFSSLQKISFPIFESKQNSVQEESEEYESPPEPSRNKLYIMVSIFSILIVILIVVFMTFRSPKTSTKIKTAPISKPVIVNSPTVIISETILPSPVSSTDRPKNAVSIQVLNGSGILGQAEKIRDRLSAAGYENVVVGNAPQLNSNSTQIVVKPNVSLNHRVEVQKTINSISANSIIRENDEIEYDILITTYTDTTTN